MIIPLPQRPRDTHGRAQPRRVPLPVDQQGPPVQLRVEDLRVEHGVARADLELEIVLQVAGGAEEDLHDLFLEERLVLLAVGAPDIGVAAGERHVQVGLVPAEPRLSRKLRRPAPIGQNKSARRLSRHPRRLIQRAIDFHRRADPATAIDRS